MSLASNNLLKTIKLNKEEKSTRLAQVVERDASKGVRVIFYGEEEASLFWYKSSYGSLPLVGNVVTMTRINGSYIITGRI